MNIFLTGGTGFIGSYVVREFIRNGHQVTILARNVNKIRDFMNNPSIKVVQGTITDRDVIKRELEGKDACIHLALGRIASAVEAAEQDTLPAIFILETAAKLGANLITTSSIAAYGNINRPYSEYAPTRPIAFYGATKAAVESFVFAIAETYKVRANIISPGLTFGNPICDGAPFNQEARLRNIIQSAKKNEPVRVIKHTGTQFIWAGDLAKLYNAVLTSDLSRRVFIGMGSEFIMWEDVAKMAIEISESKSELIVEEKDINNVTPNMVRNYPIDVSAIENAFGFKFISRQKLRDHIKFLLNYYN